MMLGDRFWSKVRMTHTCWIWTAQRSLGYGKYYHNKKLRWAHRVAYEGMVGPISGGLEIDHLCRNRACVNPQHLEPVTHAENVRRGPGASADNRAKTHCLNGHPLTPANVYSHPKGWRICKVCGRGRDKARSRRGRNG